MVDQCLEFGLVAAVTREKSTNAVSCCDCVPSGLACHHETHCLTRLVCFAASERVSAAERSTGSNYFCSICNRKLIFPRVKNEKSDMFL